MLFRSVSPINGYSVVSFTKPKILTLKDRTLCAQLSPEESLSCATRQSNPDALLFHKADPPLKDEGRLGTYTLAGGPVTTSHVAVENWRRKVGKLTDMEQIPSLSMVIVGTLILQLDTTFKVFDTEKLELHVREITTGKAIFWQYKAIVEVN